MKLTPKQLDIACSRCTHFNGIQNTACEAGVSYASFPGTKPCLDRFNRDGATCDKRRAVTADEAQAEEDEHEAWSLQMNKALPIVAECKEITSKGGDTSFSRVCPICGQELRIRVSPGNLHAKVTCKTSNCIFWIE